MKTRASSLSSIPVTAKQLPARRSGLLKPAEEKSEPGAPAIGDAHTNVDSNEPPHGQMQIYQPDKTARPRVHSKLGAGVLRSTDYGETWRHLGIAMEQIVVFGTPKRVHAMFAWACGGCLLDPALQSAPQPGGSGWGTHVTSARDDDRTRASRGSVRRRQLHYSDGQLTRGLLALRRVSGPRRAIYRLPPPVTAERRLPAVGGVRPARAERLRPTPEHAPRSAMKNGWFPRSL